MAEIKNQIRGRRNHAVGQIFEKYIDRSCEYYRLLKIADITKTPEPFHVTKHLNGGLMQGYFEKSAQPDYKGIFCNGATIIFEAKHTDKDRIQQSAVTDTQREFFERYEQFGAYCFVMVSMGLQEVFRVPWSVWKNMKEQFGHKYMNREELEPYKVKYKNCTFLILDGIDIDVND